MGAAQGHAYEQAALLAPSACAMSCATGPHRARGTRSAPRGTELRARLIAPPLSDASLWERANVRLHLGKTRAWNATQLAAAHVSLERSRPTSTRRTGHAGAASCFFPAALRTGATAATAFRLCPTCQKAWLILLLRERPRSTFCCAALTAARSAATSRLAAYGASWANSMLVVETPLRYTRSARGRHGDSDPLLIRGEGPGKKRATGNCISAVLRSPAPIREPGNDTNIV